MFKTLTSRGSALLLAALLFFTIVRGQTKTISGKVTSEQDGTPMEGVSVTVKGKTTGTQTNPNGTFTIGAAPTDVLVLSYLGYSPQEVAVGVSNTLNLTLTQSNKKMDEVVVVGYGTQARKNLTNAVAKLD